MARETTMPIVRVREGEIMRRRWRQYEVISDDSVIIIHMNEALFGWNFGRVERQGTEAWCGMNAAGILAFKSDDPCARPANNAERDVVLAHVAAL